MADDRFLLPTARLAFPALAKPEAFNDGDPQYGVTLLWEKAADLAEFKGRIRAALTGRWPNLSKQQAATLGVPLRDGDLKPEWGGFPGSVYARAKTKLPPSLFGRGKDPATGKLEVVSPTVFYAGCYVRAYCSLYVYDQKGNKGVRLTLSALQFFADGEPLALLVPDGEKVFGAPDANAEVFGNTSGDGEADTPERELMDFMK